MRENVLLNKVYTKFHKRLYDLKSSEIGASFPSYQVKLGQTLRIHGIQKSLAELQNENWLGGLIGYCDVSVIEKIPAQIEGYRTVSRIQTTMSYAKLKRLKQRRSIKPEEEKIYKARMFSKGIDNPYLELKSTSNGQKHRRYIEFGEILENPVNGLFDSFGLSKKATIPWF